MSDIIKIIKRTAACFGNMYIHIQMRVKPCAQITDWWRRTNLIISDSNAINRHFCDHEKVKWYISCFYGSSVSCWQMSWSFKFHWSYSISFCFGNVDEIFLSLKFRGEGVCARACPKGAKFRGCGRLLRAVIFGKYKIKQWPKPDETSICQQSLQNDWKYPLDFCTLEML